VSLAAAAVAGLPIPAVANALGYLAVAVASWLLVVIGRRFGQPVVGVVAGVLLPFSTLLVPTVGSETPIQVALVLAAIWLVGERRLALAVVVMAVATMVRADSVVAGVPLAAWVLWSRRPLDLPGLARAAAPGVALLAVGVALTQWYFGRPFPVTLAAKQHQLDLLGSRSFFARLLDETARLWSYGLFRPVLVLAVVGLVWGVARRSPWMVVIAWAALYALAYSLLMIASYFWYYAPLVPALVVAAGLGADALVHAVRRWAPEPAAALAIGLVALLVAPGLWAQARVLTAREDARMAVFEEAGRWLRDNTPPGASVGMLEVGVIGYHAEREVVDFAGLIQADVAEAMVPGHTYEASARYALATYEPDYVLLVRRQLPGVEQEVADRCDVVASFDDERVPVDIHRC
jgi:hypothetical protein